ncbi:hypothetical protein ACQ4PT_071921 [Festuca glaucescens]
MVAVEGTAMVAGEVLTRVAADSMLVAAALARVVAALVRDAAAMATLVDLTCHGDASIMLAVVVAMATDQGVDIQTVQAVVAAVTAATKVSEPPVVRVSQVADSGMAVEQQVGTPAAAPNPTIQQPIVSGQEAQAILEAGAKGKDNEVQGPPKKKKEDKAGCFRCKQPGHYIDDCPTPFCDICESIHHATAACHLLNAPKPTAILHGYANEALMFFELSCGAFKAKAENPKLAKVTVDGDAMTIPQLIEQLKKIVPSEKFVWEVFHFKDNVYRVKLPSKLEVQRYEAQVIALGILAR